MDGFQGFAMFVLAIGLYFNVMFISMGIHDTIALLEQQNELLEELMESQ